MVISFSFRVKIVSKGKKRKLVISDTLRADGGEISVHTNTDKSKCKLKVAYANRFLTGMLPKTTVVEREPFTSTVEVKVHIEVQTYIYTSDLKIYVICDRNFINNMRQNYVSRTRKLLLNFSLAEKKSWKGLMTELRSNIWVMENTSL